MNDRDDHKTHLHSSFGKSTETGENSHPFGSKILEQSRNLLKKSRTGTHLVNISDSYGFKPDVTPSPEQNGFLYLDGSMNIPVPVAQNTSDPRQALELAARLRDAEQGILGYKRDRDDLPPEELEAQNHAKNLDIIVDLCRISVELENEAPEVKNELFKMGYRHIFEAFKEKSGSNDALLNAYEKMIEETKSE